MLLDKLKVTEQLSSTLVQSLVNNSVSTIRLYCA